MADDLLFFTFQHLITSSCSKQRWSVQHTRLDDQFQLQGDCTGRFVGGNLFPNNHGPILTYCKDCQRDWQRFASNCKPSNLYIQALIFGLFTVNCCFMQLSTHSITNSYQTDSILLPFYHQSHSADCKWSPSGCRPWSCLWFKDMWDRKFIVFDRNNRVCATDVTVTPLFAVVFWVGTKQSTKIMKQMVDALFGFCATKQQMIQA